MMYVLIVLWGGGNHIIAFKQTRRRFLGFEIEKKYFDVAIKRIKKEEEQTRILENV